jgi:hypothetical protein
LIHFNAKGISLALAYPNLWTITSTLLNLDPQKMKSLPFFNSILIHKLSLLFLISAFFGGCVPTRQSSTHSGKNNFESFYGGENGMQYFIKPILLKNMGKEEYLIADFTFRHRNEPTDSVTVNFSIEGNDLHRIIDSLVISNNSISVATEKVKLLFNERGKRGYSSRFTAKVSLNDMVYLFEQRTWDYKIYRGASSTTFRPTPKSEKTISTVNTNLFNLL